MVLGRVVGFFIGLIILASAWQPYSDHELKSDHLQDQQNDTIIYIIHADNQEWRISENGKETEQIYTGKVILFQDSVFMFCDSAYIKDSVLLSAYGNVVIQQNDSVRVFADTLIYQGVLKEADLYGDVILENGGQKLFTNNLKYYLTPKIAIYDRGATLHDQGTFLSSRAGTYYVQEDRARFRDSVHVNGEEFLMRTDSLEYLSATKTAHFIAPTVIHQSTKRIYCESGFYDIQREIAQFSQNAEFVDTNKQAKADTILYFRQDQRIEMRGHVEYHEADRHLTSDYLRYHEDTEFAYIQGNATFRDSVRHVRSNNIFYAAKQDSFVLQQRSIFADRNQILEADYSVFSQSTGVGIAYGQVIWQDTANHLLIRCDSMAYNREQDFLQAMGQSERPWLVSIIDGDSLFVRADTLIYQKSTVADSLHVLLAYHDVRIFKSDLQGLCDSLAYQEADSTFSLFKDPIIWNDSTQLTGDTIQLFVANNKLDRLALLQNAFIVNTVDELFFNQIKGRIINAKVRDGALQDVLVNGNAETLYYVLDEENAYIGVDRSDCSRITIEFIDEGVSFVHKYGATNSAFYPMNQADHKALTIEGFVWRFSSRPKSKSEL